MIQDGHEPRAEVTEVTSHSMDRKIQISAKEETAEGQGTEKKTDPEVYVCLNLYRFYTLARIARVN